MNKLGSSLLAASIALAFAAPVAAHHSAAAFNTQQEVTVSGSITQYTYRNPHVYMTLSVRRDDGTVGDMVVEAGAVSVIGPLGFTRDAVAVGDTVTIIGNPGRRDPQALLLGRELYKQDGSYYPLNISSRSLYEAGNETADSIAGTWFSPRTEFFRFLGSAGGWPVTERGREAMSNVDPLATPQGECIPIAAPALMFYPVASTVTIEEDRVVFNVDWMDSERVVYLDGREPPPASETFLHGFSVGHWEDDTLVVRTTHFSEHPMGLSTSLPGSTEKSLVERFRLGDDRQSLVYSGVIEDPVYLSAPVEWSGAWEYRPTMPHSNEACDIDVARQFLDDF